MVERIKLIQESHHLTQREFASVLGISPSSLSSIYNGHTLPTKNHVLAIHNRFPDINVTWLMFGEGEMTSGATSADEANQDAGKTDGSVRPIENAAPTVSSADDGYVVQAPSNDTTVPGQVIIRETVKYVDKPQRRITEIRVFYDDGTFDTFSGN